MNPELAAGTQIISAITLVAGFVFATYQFGAFRRQRQAEVALTIINNHWPAELIARTAQRIWTLPDHADAASVDALGPEVQQAILVACISYENLGYLVFKRIVPLGMFDELMGGTARMTYRKVSGWIERTRAESGNANAFEWFQWLYERLEEHPHPVKEPGAHVAHRDWRP